MDLDTEELWDGDFEEEDWLSSDDRNRDDDELLIFGDLKPPRDEIDALLDGMLSSALERTHPIMGPVLRRSDELYPHLQRLITMKPSQQRKALRHSPYRDLTMANLLLDECDRVVATDPRRAERYALLAQWISEQPWPDEPKKATWVRFSAYLAQAKACQMRHDWHAAELRFASAFTFLQEIPVTLEHGLFCWKLSRLREDQGRYYEASTLQIHAMHLHCWRWNTDKLPSDDLVRLAFLALKQNDPARAMSIFTQVCLEDREDDRLSYRLQLEVAFGRAICLAALGLGEPAQALIDESLPERRRIDSRERRLPFEWLECRIAVHLGDLRRAIPRLEAIRRWLIDDRELEKVCLCSIDLVLAYTKKGKGKAAQQFPGLLKDIAELPGAAEQPWALGALWYLREALEKGQDPAVAARAAAKIVAQRERSLTHLTAGLDTSTVNR